MKTLGQVAYEAYFAFSNGKSLISGASLLTWHMQSHAIQQAWETAAEAVVVHQEGRSKA
jgi:hypothetical protein